MSDSVAAAPAAASPKKTKGAAKPKVKKPKVAATHPPIAAMVNAAIKNLKDRKGSSLAAIKKYINANYKCDSHKLAPFIRKYLKKAVAEGALIQTKGIGAAGSFKLKGKDHAEEKPKAVKKPKAKKPAAEKKAKKPKAKTPVKTKKPKAAKAKTPKKAKAAKPKKAKKSPAKAKKAAKKPAAKKAAKK